MHSPQPVAISGDAILDCETYQSSIQCLAECYAAKVSDVESYLSALDLEEQYRRKKISVRGDEYLAELFLSTFGKPAKRWDTVCWFHLTRVPASTDFAEGILPLRLALEKIWTTVLSAADRPRKRAILERLRDMGVPDRQYNLKAGVALHDGPYAMLVRESAFHSAAIGNHDYLTMPEIIEDICNGYERHTGERILDEIASALKPCIVKFEHPDSDHDQHLANVLLYYCWSKCRDEELCYLANTCFDAKGKAIPRLAIRRIEFL